MEFTKRSKRARNGEKCAWPAYRFVLAHCIWLLVVVFCASWSRTSLAQAEQASSTPPAGAPGEPAKPRSAKKKPAESVEPPDGGRPDAAAADGGPAGATSSSAAPSGAPTTTQSAPEDKAVVTATEPEHEFRSVRATGDIVRGVLVGSAVSLELNEALKPGTNAVVELTPLDPDQSRSSRAPKPVRMRIQGFPDKSIVATVPEDTEPGLYEITVRLSKGQEITLQRPQQLRVKGVGWIVGIALLPLGAMIVLTLLLLSQHRRAELADRYSVWSFLFFEPENQTYSLSRAQFILWSCAITWSYVFLFVGRGVVESQWQFPPLSGFGMTFLISLGTLVGAQATTTWKGPKGAGQLHPSPADLIMHGGVLALERVQQLLWTLIAIAMFLVVVFKSYATATELPTIPEELLVLMGISSAGYLAGKVARKAGPIIEWVRATPGSVVLTIGGKQLSKDAFVWVDGKRLDAKPTAASVDPTDTLEFARTLRVVHKLGDAPADAEEVSLWEGEERSVMLVNSDGQRAEWLSSPVISSAQLEELAQSQFVLRVEGKHIGTGATWNVTGDAKITTDKDATRDPETPTHWLIPVTPLVPRPGRTGELTVTTTTGRVATVRWAERAGPMPPTSPSKSPDPARKGGP